MSTSPKVDVLIPVYNAVATIEAAVRSIQTQTLRDIRMIIIDDGSTDGSGEVLAELAADDSRIQLVRQSNGGIVDALNNGLQLCTAPFVARHDADDLAAPERFAEQIEYLQAYPNCVAVDGYFWQIDVNGSRFGNYAGVFGPASYDAKSFPSKEPYLMHPFLMVRTGPLKAVGGYRYVFHSEDTDLYWRLLRYGELRHIPTFLGEYRFHEGSVSAKSILNGRIAAINSQLAAVSYRRRETGRCDLEFPRGNLRRYQEAGDLRSMLKIAGEQLDAAEQHWLHIATCAKLLELASYRHYLPEASDIVLCVEVLDRNKGLLSEAMPYIQDKRSTVAARLIWAGRWSAGLRLSSDHGLSARLSARRARSVLRRVSRRLMGTPAPDA